MFNDAPLPSDSSIRDFQQRRDGYVADSLEQALLLSRDMTELKLKEAQSVPHLKEGLGLGKFLLLSSEPASSHPFFFFFLNFS